MKIAFFLTSLANKGPTIATRDLIKSLIGQAEMEVFYFDDIVELDMLVKTKRVNFFEKIKFEDYDILHSCMFRPDMYLYLHGFTKGKRFFNKCISSIHCIIPEDLTFIYGKFISGIFSFIWLKALDSFNVVTVSSDMMYQFYSQSFKKTEIYVIPYGRDIIPYCDIPKEDEVRILELKSKYQIIGTIGSLIKRKNTEEVLFFLAENTSFGLVSLGVGEEEENLKKMAYDLNISERILFLGFRPDSRQYYRYFDVFTLPSRSEGFALVLIDALGYKVPTVISKLDIYSGVLSESEVAFFELDNHESFFQAVEKAIENKERFIVNAYNKFEELFSLKSLGLKYIDLYRKIILKRK